MRWSAKRHDKNWRLWLAWYPVRIDETYVWLEWVDRRHHCGQEICYLEFRSPSSPAGPMARPMSRREIRSRSMED